MSNETDERLLAADFLKTGDQYYLLLDYRNDSKLIGWGNQGAHMRPEILEWLKANTPTFSLSGGGTTAHTVMLLFKGARDASLFRMFWM